MWLDLLLREKSRCLSNITVGQSSRSLRRHSDIGRGGVDRSSHLNALLQHLSLFLLEIRVICKRHFVVESMRRRAGERGGWKERNIQTEGNVRGEERGRIFREGKMKSKWGSMGGFQFLCVFFFLWVTRPSSLRRQWHNAEDADWNYKLGSCRRKPELSYSPPHLRTHTYVCTKELPHISTQEMLVYLVYSLWIHYMVCNDLCLLCSLPAVCV